MRLGLAKTLRVGLPGRRVGTLAQERSGRVVWTPDPDWEAAEQLPRLGVEFLRSPGVKRAATGLTPWFENLLPEADSPLRIRLAAAHGLRDTQSFALLAATGADLAGAVDVSPESASSSEPPPPDDSVGPRAAPPADSNEVGDDEDEEAPVTRISSLAGMQLKFSMSMVHQRLAIPARGRAGQWIVKFAGERYPELVEIESATMTWAREAGFDVPPHFVLGADRLDGLPEAWIHGLGTVFAVQRFDRRDDGSRIHQEDLCQALNLPPLNKYGDRSPRVTFDAALRFVVDVCGEASGREMARRMGFVIASGNGDAHLKNWSLLWGSARRPVLTPCYDLVCTVAWDELGWARRGGPDLALAMGGARRFAALGADAVARSAERSGQPWLASELAEGIQRARDAWPRIEERAPSRMRDALRVHWEEVPLLRGDVARPG